MNRGGRVILRWEFSFVLGLRFYLYSLIYLGLRVFCVLFSTFFLVGRLGFR